MQQLPSRLLFLITLFASLSLSSFGQACFRIESILVDACATDEGQNEMVRFKVGSIALNTAQMNVSWATTTNSWGGVCQNATTTNLINQINASIINCGFVRAPIGGILPANSNVILITGTQFIPANNSFANLSDTVYVIFQCGSSLVGNFANVGTGIRTFSMSFLAPAACTQTVQYDRALLVGGNGAVVNYTSTGIASYDNAGCSAPVVIYDPAWTPPAPLCSSAGSINLNDLVTGDLGGIWSGPGVTGNTFDPSGLNGDIDITYQFGASSCISAVSETNTIELLSSGNSSWTVPASLCSGDAAINLNPLITGTTGGTWSGDGVTGNTFNPSGLSGDISVTYTVGSGSCASTTSSVIQVANASNASWTIPPAICSGDAAINLNSQITGTTGGTWSGSGITGNSFNPNGLSGSISITYSVGSGTCVNTSTQNITVNQGGNSSWTAPSSVCANNPSINLNALITGTTGGTWAGTGVTGNTFNPSGLSGDISVTYTVGSGSCASTASNTIQVLTNSNASWTIPPAMCSGDAAINLNSQITGTTGGTWTGSGITGNSFNPNGLSGSISITYSVGSGTCANTSTQNITVNQGGNSGWTAPSSVCANDPSINLNALITGTTGGTWVGTGVTGNMFNPLGQTGSISVTYSVGTGNCISNTTNAILVTGASNPSWTTTSLCESENAINLTTLITGTAGGTWSGSGISGNSFSPNGLNGLISVTYTVGTGSCLQASTQSIDVRTSPSAPFLTGDDTYCQNETIGPITATGDAGAIFSWAISDAPEVEIFSGSVFTPTETVSTNYQVTQSVNACRSLASMFSLFINERPAAPILPAQITICSGTPAQVLTVESNANVFWFSSAAGTVSIAQGLTLNPDDFGYADYSAIAIMNGCSSAVSLTNVIQGEGITADILGNDIRTICFPQIVTLQSADATKNLWSTGATSNSIAVSRPGIYILQRFSDCAIGRDTVELIDVGVSANFLLSYPELGFFPIDATLESISENSTNCAFYLNGLTIEPDGNGILTLEQDTTYSLQQICSNNFGCRDTVTRIIDIKSPSELYIPNAFTPNGDFYNEVFAAKGFQIVSLQIIIFNRWGEEVYVIKDLNDSWDGNTKAGTLAPEGVYTYKLRAIDFRQKPIELSGTLMLMR